MAKYRVTIEDRIYNVEVEEMGGSGEQGKTDQDTVAPKAASEPQKAGPVAGTKVESPLSGNIVSVSVKVGDHVNEGDILVSLEALKLENEISAPVSGKIVQIVSEGDAVETGEVLAVIN